MHFFTLTIKYKKWNVKNKNFKNCKPQNEILSNNLTKEVKDLYAENYKTQIKETEVDFKKKERYPMLLDWKN